MVLAMPDVLNGNLIFLHPTLDAAIKQSEAATRKHCGHWPVKVRIEHLRLAKVRQLRGSCNISDGWQQRVLHNRPQQDVGREIKRLVFDLVLQFAERSLAVADRILIATGVYRQTVSVPISKEKRRIFSYVDLRVVARFDKFNRT